MNKAKMVGIKKNTYNIGINLLKLPTRKKKGKAYMLDRFNEAHDDDVIQALSQLGKSDLPSNETLEAVEKLVCQLFLSKTDICSLRALRWWLFTKKQAKLQQLPPHRLRCIMRFSVPTISYKYGTTTYYPIQF